MATWVTHLIIADNIIEHFNNLDVRGFCVGNIAPDCNIENEDWTSFTPSRKITHWMSEDKKVASDCDSFYQEYIIRHMSRIQSKEHYSFLLGYYAHLITDAAFQMFIRDENRVVAIWKRMKNDHILRIKAKDYPENWDSVKKIISKREILNEIYTMEAEYLQVHPNSGYLSEILPLKTFPDYIDYLPHGSIVRKIKIMGYLPELDSKLNNPIVISRDEYDRFIDNTTSLVMRKFREYDLV